MIFQKAMAILCGSASENIFFLALFANPTQNVLPFNTQASCCIYCMQQFDSSYFTVLVKTF